MAEPLAPQSPRTPSAVTTASDPTELDPRYVEARRVLLDTLTALAPHDAAIVVAGAQAIYLRTGAGDITVAPYTTDGDLVVDPTSLSAEPAIEAAMTAAGFTSPLPRADMSSLGSGSQSQRSAASLT